MTNAQINALRAVAAAIIDSVKAAGPTGASGGVIYAALMAQGCTLSQYQSIMSGLVRAGMLTQNGDCYFVAGGAA